MVNLLKPSNTYKRALVQHLKSLLINPLVFSFLAVSTAPHVIRTTINSPKKHIVPENRSNTFMKKSYNK
ncbi:hypothetical protein Hanom_Chr01g00001151 [Helianthus anomalus]